jgi:cellulose synthase/poly-beta-1,6-N-acetylglucosamine synthase-like glycosyltransferase
VPSVPLSIGILSLAIWLYLVFARGNFWSLREFDDDAAQHTTPNKWPSVVAIVPARNEAETIGQTLAALLQQDYPGKLSVIVVDDHSEDATSPIARRTAQEKNAGSRVEIHPASTLPAGWTGKLWALHEAVTRAATGAAKRALPDELREGTASVYPEERRAVPEDSTKPRALAPEGRVLSGALVDETLPAFYWFTDADIVHAPDTLRRLISRAEQNKLDLTSLMVLLQAKTLPERALIPAFLFFFLKLYPPRWTADANASTAGAAGGCILLRRESLERLGGLPTIRNEVIDDCALARAVKRSGGKIWMGLTRASVSLRAYRTFSEIRDMIARTAFTQLRYSALLLSGTLAGMFFTYLAPVALLFMHDPVPRVLGLATWLLMSASFLPTVRFYRVSLLWAPLLPLTALFYSYATWISAARYWLGRGGEWKGRPQAHRAA